MKALAIYGLGLTALIASSAHAACENPDMVEVPDGATATMDDLLAVQASVKEYMESMEQYLACLNEGLEAAGEDAPAEFKTLMITRHNTAVTEMETIAAKFNEEVQAYRAANPDEQPRN
jgi:hypothetical protein